MKLTLRALAALLGYPSDELKFHLTELRAALEAEEALSLSDRRRLDPLLNGVETSDLLDRQAA